jgi:hypothetical protein
MTVASNPGSKPFTIVLAPITASLQVCRLWRRLSNFGSNRRDPFQASKYAQADGAAALAARHLEPAEPRDCGTAKFWVGVGESACGGFRASCHSGKIFVQAIPHFLVRPRFDPEDESTTQMPSSPSDQISV